MTGRQVIPEASVPSRDGMEYLFNAPFAVVNAAVFHAVSLALTPMGATATRDDTAGATSHYFSFITGERMVLFVLQRDENLTSVQFHPFAAPDGLSLSYDAMAAMIALLRDCYHEIHRVMRYKYPDLGWVPVEGITPPMPTYQREGWRAVFLWHATYAAEWSDSTLAGKQGVSIHTVSNQRVKLNASRRRIQKESGNSRGKVSKKK